MYAQCQLSYLNKTVSYSTIRLPPIQSLTQSIILLYFYFFTSLLLYFFTSTSLLLLLYFYFFTSTSLLLLLYFYFFTSTSLLLSSSEDFTSTSLLLLLLLLLLFYFYFSFTSTSFLAGGANSGATPKLIHGKWDKGTRAYFFPIFQFFQFSNFSNFPIFTFFQFLLFSNFYFFTFFQFFYFFQFLLFSTFSNFYFFQLTDCHQWLSTNQSTQQCVTDCPGGNLTVLPSTLPLLFTSLKAIPTRPHTHLILPPLLLTPLKLRTALDAMGNPKYPICKNHANFTKILNLFFTLYI